MPIDNFDVKMLNRWFVTKYESFNVPHGDELQENLRVKLTDSILSIAALKDGSDDIEAVIAARKSIDLDETDLTMFVIVEDNLTVSNKHFPAMGTAVVFREDGKLRMRAAGYDRNGAPKGWIFNATEL